MANGNGAAVIETTRTEQLNQLVRAIVVLLLTGAFIFGFIVSKVVSTESFAIVFGIAMTWWFKSRDEQKGDGKPMSAPLPGGSTP